MSLPIYPTPSLNLKEWLKFTKKVEEDLKHPTGPIPTPRVDKAIKDMMADTQLCLRAERNQMPKTLNPSEAVYGFAAWLTCRDEKTVMSASDDAAVVADLVVQFCQVNNLPEVSGDWPNNLIHPQ